MYLFERLMWILTQINYKNRKISKIIEIFLIKTELNYKNYKDGHVLKLLQNYNQIHYVELEILSKIAESYITNQINNITPFCELILTFIKNPEYSNKILKMAIISGSIQLLKFIIKTINDNKITMKNPILISCIKYSIYVKNKNIKNYYNCYNYILENDINTLECQNIIYRETPLHIANNINNLYIIKKLLDKNSPLCIKNIFEKFPISNIPIKYLISFFDKTIQNKPKHFIKGDDQWNIIKGLFLKDFDLENCIFIDFSALILNNEEFIEIELLNEFKKTKNLITHVVLEILIDIYWDKFKYILCINDFITVIGAILVLLLYFFKNSYRHIYNIILIIIIIVELIDNYQIIKGILKILFNKIKFKKPLNKNKNTLYFKYIYLIFIKWPFLIIGYLINYYDCTTICVPIYIPNLYFDISFSNITININFNTNMVLNNYNCKIFIYILNFLLVNILSIIIIYCNKILAVKLIKFYYVIIKIIKKIIILLLLFGFSLIFIILKYIYDKDNIYFIILFILFIVFLNIIFTEIILKIKNDNNINYKFIQITILYEFLNLYRNSYKFKYIKSPLLSNMNKNIIKINLITKKVYLMNDFNDYLLINHLSLRLINKLKKYY